MEKKYVTSINSKLYFGYLIKQNTGFALVYTACLESIASINFKLRRILTPLALNFMYIVLFEFSYNTLRHTLNFGKTVPCLLLQLIRV